MFLLEDTDSYICSIFNLLRDVLLVEVYKDNPTSCRCVVGKRRSISVAFSHYCGYFSLTLYQKSTHGSFLKFFYNVKAESIQWFFSSSVILKSIGLSYTLWIFCLCMSLCLCTLLFGKYCCIEYANLSKVDTFHYPHRKLTWLIPPPVSSERSLSISNLSSSKWQVQVFQNILSYCCFSCNGRLIVCFWENFCQKPKCE